MTLSKMGWSWRLRQAVGCLLLAGWASMAMADLPGQIYPAGKSPHIYRVSLKQGALTNIVGSTVQYTYSLGSNFTGYTQCSFAGQSSNSMPFIYTARTSLPPSDMNGHLGYRKLNEYIDVKVDIWVAGKLEKYVLAPFESVSNNYTANTMRCNNANPPIATWTNFASSSKGIVTFKLRKPVINGISVNSREIIEMYGVMKLPDQGSLPPLGNVPMARLFIETALLTVPDKCVVNAGRQIEVDFNDVPQMKLDGSRYVRNIPVSYQCSGGSFDSGMKGISIGVSARPASFSNDYIDTTSKDLGIVIKHKGKLVRPNEFTKLPANQTNSGSWDLTAAPISSGANIPLGDFTANGTIVMEFSEIN